MKPRNAKPVWRRPRRLGPVGKGVPINHYLRRRGYEISPNEKLYPNMTSFIVKPRIDGSWAYRPVRRQQP